MQLPHTWAILIAVLAAANMEFLSPFFTDSTTSGSGVAHAADFKGEPVTVAAVPQFPQAEASAAPPKAKHEASQRFGTNYTDTSTKDPGAVPMPDGDLQNINAFPSQPGEAASFIQQLLDESEPKSICDDPILVSARSKVSAWINKKRRIMAERAQLVSHRAEAMQAKDLHVNNTQFSKANTAVLDVRQTTIRIEQKTREHSEADAIVGKGQQDLVDVILKVAENKLEKVLRLEGAMQLERDFAVTSSREKDATADQHSAKHQSIVKWTAEYEQWVESQEKALDTDRLAIHARMTEAVAPLELARDRTAAKAGEIAVQIEELERKLAAKRAEMQDTRERHEEYVDNVEATTIKYKAQLNEVDRKSRLLDTWRDGIAKNWTLANEELNSANEARKAAQKVLHGSFVLGNMTSQRVEQLRRASRDYTCVANVKKAFEETLEKVRAEELKANIEVKEALDKVTHEIAVTDKVELELDRVLISIAKAEESVMVAKKRQEQHKADRDRWIASGNYKNADNAETAIQYEAEEADKASRQVQELKPQKKKADENLEAQQEVLSEANNQLGAAKAAAAQARYNTLSLRVQMAEANEAVRALEEVDSINQQMTMDRWEMAELHTMYNITTATSKQHHDTASFGKCDAVVCESVLAREPSTAPGVS